MIEILLGIAAGTISGMGMGGGVILILCLTMFIAIPQKTAQATNLIFFIPTSLVAICMNIKNKKVDFKVAKGVITAGILGAIIGAKIAQVMDVNNLKKLFGLFLVGITLHEIDCYRKEYKKTKMNHTKDK